MNRKQRLFFVFAGMAMSAAAARADINITFDNPAQTGVPGSTLQFFGTINNTGPYTIFLVGVFLDFDLRGRDFTPSVGSSFYPEGIAVAGGGSTGDIELFDETVRNPFPDAFTTYNGTYTLLGGRDLDAEQLLGSANFSVTVTPEPRMWAPVLLLGGLTAIAAWVRRKRSQTTAN